MRTFGFIPSHRKLLGYGLDNSGNTYRLEIIPNYKQGILNEKYPFILRVFNGKFARDMDIIFEDKGTYEEILDVLADVVSGYYLDIETEPSKELFNKLITDPVFPKAEYWYEVSTWRYYAGYYYNTDIHAYTEEGDYDRPGDDWVSDVYTSWEELEDALDEESFLEDVVLDVEPETIEKAIESTDHKVLEYVVDLEKQDEDDYGHVSDYIESCTITIFAK